MALARSILNEGTWANGYARLVRTAAQARPVGRAAGSALAALERGEAVRAPALADALSDDQTANVVLRVPGPSVGVGLVAGSRTSNKAIRFLQVLNRHDLLRDSGSSRGTGEEGLLADLLGATLVDAQDELLRAWEVLDREGHPALPDRRLTEAPTWPPASVLELKKEGLVETLAAQIAPDMDVRVWLLESWNEPTTPIDGEVLRRLAGAVDGKLLAEPRFRSWLRGEWTAWARQRYRRAARLALWAAEMNRS